MTIVPRLIASGADLTRIYSIRIDGSDSALLSLPKDNADLRNVIVSNDVALVIFDPLISQLDGKLDSHKDSEIRQGLEPLHAMAEDTGCIMLGLIHFNKGSSDNVLDRVMGSKAFTAVARSVHAVLPDKDKDKGYGHLLTIKNNLGRLGLPALQYHIESAQVPITERKPDDDTHTSVGIVVWDEDSEETAEEVFERFSAPKARVIESSSPQAVRNVLGEHIYQLLKDNNNELLVEQVYLDCITNGLIEDTVSGRKRAQRARDAMGISSKRATGERSAHMWYLTELTEGM